MSGGIIGQLDRVYVGTATTGTGTVAPGSKVTNAYCTPAEAGAVDGASYRWMLEDGNDFEVFEGTYSSSGPTVTRDKVNISSIAGVVGTTKLTLSGLATLRIILAAEDIRARADGLLLQLNASSAGVNSALAQPLFPAYPNGVPVAANTVYRFEASADLNRNAGTTSHTISLLFGGTATINNMFYVVTAVTASALDAFGFNAAATVISPAISSASVNAAFAVRGTVSINAAGLLLPQYILSAAPGGAYATFTGAMFRLVPIGKAGADVNIGNWT